MTLNKRSPFAKWLSGWIDAGGFSGSRTISIAWDYAQESGKPVGCSWRAYGYLMAREQQHGRDGR